jgi:hypothetical protein
MSPPRSILGDITYSFAALSQHLSLGRISEGSRDRRLPLAELHTPEWFAAAAEEHASLLDMAPELRINEGPVDLVGIYGDDVPPPVPPPQPTSDSARIGLLRELDGLDD